jgi:thiol-disulfide isomerase/thioredoxin
MIPLGTKAPTFTLPDTISGEQYSLGAMKGRTATVIMFICNHCPFVKHVNPELVRLVRDYVDKGIGFVAISSNDVNQYPEDSPEQMELTARSLSYNFPYLYDETQEVAHAYDAACTPDFYVFDKNLVLVYRGQLDDSRPGNDKSLTGIDIRNALDALLSNKPVSREQKPSIGCNIKWKQKN